jgi:membrane protein DedA with SNARE-associated domain
VIVPSLLPPPTPFKVFVLSAGTFGISWPKFLTAVIIGRSIRYFSEGILAVLYGPEAIQFVQQNYGKVGLGLALLIVASAAIYFFTRRRIRNSEA